MKTGIALLLALAGVATVAFALQTPPPAPPASAKPASQPAPSAPADQVQKTAEEIMKTPKGVPVPDMPIVKKQELEGGLIVEDMKIGTGAEVKAGGAVVAYYHGTRKNDGFVFDSAFERGEPLGFSLNNVVVGWKQGVPGMKVGGIRKLTVPAALGYGASGNGPDIPPNTDLVFVIQLEDAVVVEDVKVGEGEAATNPCIAVTTHTVKDKDGKEIEKVEAAAPYVWLPGEFMTQMQYDAMQGALDGMKVGGTRKIHMPGGFNQPNPGLGGKRPGNVPLDFEVHMVGLRNLPQQQRRR